MNIEKIMRSLDFTPNQGSISRFENFLNLFFKCLKITSYCIDFYKYGKF